MQLIGDLGHFYCKYNQRTHEHWEKVMWNLSMAG
jgi:hypothetical protein